MQFIVDECVPSRGHRSNIFKKNFGAIGTFTGPHKNYGLMANVDFAVGFDAFKTEPTPEEPTPEEPTPEEPTPEEPTPEEPKETW
jgi:hypothetical protein